jgi:hypothetical protein
LPCVVTVIAAAILLIGLPLVQGQRPRPSEYEVKATYLYNFSKFVDWPAKGTHSQSDSFTICVLGEDPFGPALNTTLADESIAGKSVVAKRIPTLQDAANCRVLFISSSEDKQLTQIFAMLGDASVLTVSDLPQFTRRGGMVQFLLQDNKIRFEVNLASAERAGLSFSSELLKVAINVKRRDRPGD